jgi:predicted O-methyltransferase YrrM
MKFSRLLAPPPVRARHVKRTFVTSPDDDAGQPTPEVIGFALDAARRAMEIDLSAIGKRIRTGPRWTDLWPGEHYRLLAAMVDLLQPRTVVEIGTFTGLSSLALKHHLPADGRVVSFDLLPWRGIPDTVLTDADFADGRLAQELANLADPGVFARHAPLLAGADLIFADGPKDGRFEPVFHALLDRLPRTRPAWVVWDDIRDLHMLQCWRDIHRPKLDITSFGHWTGTGLVRWT